jgi:outer membrane protein OmpA-like peptidoglycan-associated protein/tetratricopeptide (TPR) repeat protein
MKHILIIIVAIVWSGFSAALFAQVDKGDAAFEDLRYQDAIQYYEKALQKRDNPEAAVKLAHSYRLTGQSEAAEQWYKKAIDGGQNGPEVRVHYAKMLLTNNKTADARQEADKVTAEAPNNLAARNIIQACDIRERLLRMGEQYTVQKAAFNAEGVDFSPNYWGDRLVFTSDRDPDGVRSDWTGRNYTSLYQVNTAGGAAERLTGNINGKYNDGAATFAPDGKTMYFTRNNYEQDERRKSKQDIVKLIITTAQLQDNNWQLGQPFAHNSNEYNTAHPALSADGNVLIFASDRPGGHGGMDLWRCDWTGASWGQPYNLGPSVNTSDNEIFPWVAPDGTLLFASNGWPGLGGLDVFLSRADANGYTTPENVGAPINSPKDDFGCISLDQMQSGFFSSNIQSSIGTEDIFQFQRKKVQPAPAPKPSAPPPPQDFALNGVVVDKYTGIPLPGVEVTLENTQTGERQTTQTKDNGRFEFALRPNSTYRVSGIKNGISTDVKTETTEGKTTPVLFTQLEHNDPRFTLRGKAVNRKTQEPVAGVDVTLFNAGTSAEEHALTDAKGAFFFQLEQNSNYTITGEKSGVFSSVKNATTMGLDRSTDLYVQLTLNVEIIEIGQEILLEDIYFDLNKSNIRPDAAKILDNMVEFMQRSPTLVVELTSHTDSRDTNEHNQALSQRRAESTMAYLVSKGIDPARMQAHGYGETQLTNRCADGVTCSEAEHQKNRRTAFKVLKL